MICVMLLALTGIHTADTAPEHGEALQFMVRVGPVLLRALVDSGSSHDFVTADLAASTTLLVVPCTAMRTVSNGDKVPCPGVLRRTPFSIDDEHFIDDIFVLPLGE